MNKNKKAEDWDIEVDEKCLICKEENCQTRFSNKKTKILIRDCQPETYENLPKYLKKAIGI